MIVQAAFFTAVTGVFATFFFDPDQLVSLEFKRVHGVNFHACRKYGCISIHRGNDR